MALDDWDLLLAQIEEGKVVPVVGRDLLQISGPDGPTFYYRELALVLADTLGIARADLPRDPDIEDVAFRYLGDPESEWDTLYSKLKEKLRQLRPGIPEPLKQLAAIEPLRLFVSTTYDDLLARALSERPRIGKLVERAYVPSASTASSQDLPADLDGSAVAIYSLFGRPDEAGDYAVTEEDTLELVHQLKAKLDPAQGELKNLGARLRQSHLLFLGCGFPDWLLRFFIRTLRGERFYSERPRKRARVADKRAEAERHLVMFLQHYGTRVYAGSAVDFVAELSRRWQERLRAAAHPAGAPPEDLRSGRPIVLVACAPEDEGSAQAVFAKLDRWGIGWAVVRYPEGDEETLRAQLDACAVYVAYLSKGVLGEKPDARLLGHWQKVQRRRQAPNLGALLTLVITLDTAAREMLRDCRGWPEWLRRSRRLRPGDDVALSVVEAAFESGRLGARPRVRLYCAFADEDKKMSERLDGQLASTRWLTVWHRGRLMPDEEVTAREAEELSAAQIIVLLASVDLLEKRKEEVDLALERHRTGTALVIPILGRSCVLGDELKELDWLPEQGEAISLAHDADLAWTEVARAVVLRACDFLLGGRVKDEVAS